MISRQKHDRMANAIRFLAMDAVEKANSGHPGLPMGAADFATVLYTRFMKHDPKHPHWPDRDRFVLSAGHGSMLLYSLLYLPATKTSTSSRSSTSASSARAPPDIPNTATPPASRRPPGRSARGSPTAVGMAIAERIMNARFGDELVDHRTYVLVGDGCLMEGISQEAIALAGHLRLNKLIVMWDNNSISIDGPVSLADNTDQAMRFQASGWNTIAADGHDPDAIQAAFEEARRSDRPTMIAFKTIIGFGAPTKAGTNKAHGSPLGAEEIAGARKALGWTSPPFEIPSDILDDWRIAGLRSARDRKEWEKRLAAADGELRAEFERRVRGELPEALEGAILDYKRKLVRDKPKVATRKASEMALEVINGTLPETVGGSADLTGSNNTRTSQTKDITPDRLFRPLYPLRHPRARHGGGDERHRAASRADPLFGHLPVLFRLCQTGDAAGLADGPARRLSS